MSRGTLTLNYLEHPIGLAMMAMVGDLGKATNQRELRLVRAHWMLAAKAFRRRARRLGRRPLGGLAGEVTGGLTHEEVYLAYLRSARRWLEARGVGPDD